MSLVEYKHYLAVTVTGTLEEKAAKPVLLEIRNQALELDKTRILIDARDVSMPVTEFDRYLVGMLFVDLFGSPFRVAVLYRAELINKFTEDTAVGRGAALLVCADEDEALRWLLGDIA